MLGGNILSKTCVHEQCMFYIPRVHNRGGEYPTTLCSVLQPFTGFMTSVMIFTNAWNHYNRVTGEANFSMQRTNLTAGGFSVAHFLTQLTGNAEKGLSQRYLWYFPKPVYGEFDSLEETDKAFTDKAGTCA